MLCTYDLLGFVAVGRLEVFSVGCTKERGVVEGRMACQRRLLYTKIQEFYDLYLWRILSIEG